MTERTCNIIKACKNYFNYADGMSQLERVKKYMSEICCTPIEHYTDNVIDNIMFEAMCDFLDSCDKPSAFMWRMEHLVYKDSLCRAAQIATTFELVQVKSKDGTKYVNGFEGVW